MKLRDERIQHGGKMDKLIRDLLEIEQKAKESLVEIEEECRQMALQIEPEIARRTKEINERTAQAIESLKLEAEAALQAELAAIENEYREKAERLRELFHKNGPAWRKEWNPINKIEARLL